MIRRIEVPDGYTLADYSLHVGLHEAVEDLRLATAQALPRLAGRTVWVVNATAQGGGVAEMLPRVVALLRQAGVRVEWLVIDAPDPRFFPLTKRLHNLMHGAEEQALDADDRALFEAGSRRLAAELGAMVAPDDLLVVHDPQPVAAGAIVAREQGLRAVWRCHIGLDRETPATRAAWDFLAPWVAAYDRAVFSLPQYVPPFLADRALILSPAIDPLSHKNREMSVPKLTGVLRVAGLIESDHPLLVPPFQARVERLGDSGGYCAAGLHDLGVLFRPCVLQVSRFDRLKGFAPLMAGFARLKALASAADRSPWQRDVLAASRLILAGPDPSGVQDDPEAAEVLDDLAARWRRLPADVRTDVALLRLPMASAKENARIVNALQRCATVVAQNSLAEGFGLTASEAMWKARATMVGPAAGLRAQIRDGVDGRVVSDAADPEAVAALLAEMLTAPKSREAWGANARARVAGSFNILRMTARWLDILAGLANAPARGPEATPPGPG